MRSPEEQSLPSSSRPLHPFLPRVVSLTHKGILEFVDHTGNLLFYPLGTMLQGEEDIYHHIGVSPITLPPPSSPLHSYFLFVYNIAKRLSSSKAWCIHTVPFFYNA